MNSIEGGKHITTQLFENSVRWQIDNSLRLQLDRITDESSLPNVTDLEIYRKRYSILRQLADLKGVKEEIERANKLEEKFCDIYQKEQGALNSSQGRSRDAYLEVVREFDNKGIIANWLPPFSDIRISLYERKEQIENPNSNIEDPVLNDALGIAFIREAEFIKTKADKVKEKAESTKNKVLLNKAALLEEESVIMGATGMGLTTTRKSILDQCSKDKETLNSLAVGLKAGSGREMFDTRKRVWNKMISEAVLHKPLVAK